MFPSGSLLFCSRSKRLRENEEKEIALAINHRYGLVGDVVAVSVDESFAEANVSKAVGVSRELCSETVFISTSSKL